MSVTIQIPSGERITADKETIFIGRDDTCDICLPDPSIQPRHAKIERISGRWLVKSEGEWELQVNDEPKGSMGWLNAGDTVVLSDDGTHLIFEPAQEIDSNANLRIKQADKIIGPVSQEKLTELLVSGQVSDNDLVSEDHGAWIPLSLFGERNVPYVEPYELEPPRPEPPRPFASTPPAAPSIPPAPSVQPPAPPQTFAAAWQPNLPILLAAGFGFLIVGLFGIYLMIRAADKQIAIVVNPNQNGEGGNGSNEDEVRTNGPSVDPKSDHGSKDEKVAEKPRKDPPAVFTPSKDAIAILCVVLLDQEGSASQSYIPLMTAWAVDEKHLVTRGVRLFFSGAKDLGKDQFLLRAVTNTKTFEVVNITYHSNLKLEKLGTGELSEDDSWKMFISDFALLEVNEKLPASLPMAEKPGLLTVPEAGRTVHLLGFEEVGEEEPINFHPKVKQIQAKLLRHDAMPNGNSNLAGIDASFRLHMDGSPVIDHRGQVIGIVNLRYDEKGRVTGKQTVLSIERVREMLKKS